MLITAPMVEARARAAPVSFQATVNVAPNWSRSQGGWVRVRHADGASGYLRSNQVWGP
jgi:hypothetical protein